MVGDSCYDLLPENERMRSIFITMLITPCVSFPFTVHVYVTYIADRYREIPAFSSYSIEQF